MEPDTNVNSHDCAICGKTIETLQPLVCNDHLIANKFAFVFRDSYLPLKELTNSLIRKHKDTIVLRVLIEDLMWFSKISTELLWDPVKFTPKEYNEQYSDMWLRAAFLGYCRSRLEEIIPNLGIRVTSIISELKSRPLRQSEITMADLIQTNLMQELSLLRFSTWYLNGYFKIATEQPENFTKIYIVPETGSSDGAGHFLKLMLMDANEQWYTWFNQLLIPTGTIKGKRSSQYVRYEPELIEKNLEVFRSCWQHVFGRPFRFTYRDYEELRDFLKWIVSPIPYNWSLKKTVRWLDEYSKSNLQEGVIKDTMTAVISNKHVQLEGRELSERVQRGDLEAELVDSAMYFSLPGVREPIWFTPAPGWYLDSLRPVFMEFAMKQNLVGRSYENDVKIFCDSFSRGFKFDRTDSFFGLSIRPSDPEGRPTQMRIIAKLIKTGHKFSTTLLGKSVDGEIDFVVFSNDSLYLIEAKSVSLASRESKKYLSEKAPLQCAKYVAWLKTSDEWKQLLEKEGISPDGVQNVRITILSSTIYGDLSVAYPDTSERFAVVPEVILFSVMAGVILGPKKNVFKPDIRGTTEALSQSHPHLEEFYIPKNYHFLEDEIVDRVAAWLGLLLFDRRKDFGSYNVPDIRPFAGTPMMLIEGAIGGTRSWILPQPIQIGSENGWEYYLGTQLANAGSTYPCKKCQVAIKYYGINEINTDFTPRCPKCGSELEQDYMPDVQSTMSKLMVKYKEKMSYAYYGNFG